MDYEECLMYAVMRDARELKRGIALFGEFLRRVAHIVALRYVLRKR